MTSRIVVSMSNIQTLRSDGKAWSERMDFGVTFWNNALSTGWIGENFGGRDMGDIGILLGIMFHARPLIGEDFDLLVRLNMASSDDLGRLYARVTDVALADELRCHRGTVHDAADRLAKKGLITIVPIPEEMARDQKFRDSKGKFSGSRIYLIAGSLEEAMSKEMGSHLMPQRATHAGLTDMDQQVAAHADLGDTVYNVGMLVHAGLTDTGNNQTSIHAGLTDMVKDPKAAHVDLTDTVKPEKTVQNAPKNCDLEGIEDARVGFSDTNICLKSVNAMCMDGSIHTHTINRDPKNEACTTLLKIGVHAEAIPDLLEKYDLDTLMAWAAIYPDAYELKIAKGVGWLIRALRENWRIEQSKYRIKCARQKRDTEAQAAAAVIAEPAPSILPENIIGDLQELGWEDSLAFVEQMWQANPQFVDAWLDYLFDKMSELENPAGRFRAGLASGALPPIGRKRKKFDEDRSRYVTGEYAEYINH